MRRTCWLVLWGGWSAGDGAMQSSLTILGDQDLPVRVGPYLLSLPNRGKRELEKGESYPDVPPPRRLGERPWKGFPGRSASFIGPEGRNAYYESPEWQKVRALVATLDMGLCRICGRAVSLGGHCHHLSYHDLKVGFPDEAHSCVLLCRECHETFHEHQRAGGEFFQKLCFLVTDFLWAENNASRAHAEVWNGFDRYRKETGTNKRLPYLEVG